MISIICTVLIGFDSDGVDTGGQKLLKPAHCFMAGGFGRENPCKISIGAHF